MLELLRITTVTGLQGDHATRGEFTHSHAQIELDDSEGPIGHHIGIE